ncbi:hypothetical protein CKAH01_06192 [Colletotrichum kahawae]|uniref:Uncharacterized protein n=1 Tax=Colletotrichum kahawae TaxID=34407 RepID=A0AAE0D4I9_COLKA|nr:hypothetical protein CKAH01_06192 [Colletotrichum kahawae]
MPSTADYYSVSNVETENTPDPEQQTTAQQPPIDDELDNNSDSERGRSSNVEGSDTATSEPKDGEHAKGFRLGPGFIDQESWAIKFLSWTWEIVLTALPPFFITVSILALNLNHKVKSSSEYGARVEEITRLGPTIYPILFAMVNSMYFDMDWYYVQASDIVSALYSASLLAPRKQQHASMDLWGRPKVPQWPWDPTQDGEKTWREVDNNALESGRDYYTSLIGVNMQGLNLSGNSTQYGFALDSNYIGFNCSMVTGRASPQDLERITFPGGNLSDVFWGRNYTRADGMPSFAPKIVLTADLTKTPYLQHAAIFEAAYLLYTSRGDPEDLSICTVFNCTAASINLQTSFICTAEGCAPQRQRQLRNIRPMRSDEVDRRFVSLRNAVGEWPHMTQVVVASSSATDNYIANDENVYANQKAQIWTGIDLDVFSRRLTAAFNTVWEAGMDPYNLTKSSLALPEDPSTLWTNQTQLTITTTKQAYHVNRDWAAILILTTTFLQIIAICGLVLKYFIRGPDILGFASSLTRGNHFVPVSGGSFQDGAERARSLRDMRVQLADVRPRDSRGYIALSAVPSVVPAGEGSDGGEEESPGLGQLKKNRMYI